MLEGNNSRLNEAVDQISDLGNKVMENIQLKQKKK